MDEDSGSMYLGGPKGLNQTINEYKQNCRISCILTGNEEYIIEEDPDEGAEAQRESKYICFYNENTDLIGVDHMLTLKDLKTHANTDQSINLKLTVFGENTLWEVI